MNDSKLANDRTFLAWLRTGISLFGLGFVVAKVALIVQPGTQAVDDQDLYSGIGVLVVLSGAALIILGQRQHASVARILDREDPAPPKRWTSGVTIGAVAGSLVLSALIIVTT